MNKKFNATINNNFYYLDDLKDSCIIDNFYEKDKILYEMLTSSKKGFIEFSFDSFLNI